MRLTLCVIIERKCFFPIRYAITREEMFSDKSLCRSAFHPITLRITLSFFACGSIFITARSISNMKVIKAAFFSLGGHICFFPIYTNNKYYICDKNCDLCFTLGNHIYFNSAQLQSAELMDSLLFSCANL